MMSDLTLPVYLFFLRRNGGARGMFFDELFHFCRHASVSGALSWSRVFFFEEFFVEDLEAENAFSTLRFHGLIGEAGAVASEGESFLRAALEKQPALSAAFDSFLAEYKGQCATSGSCFVNAENFTVACHLCADRSCLRKKPNWKDWKSAFLPEKALKRPFKSVPIN